MVRAGLFLSAIFDRGALRQERGGRHSSRRGGPDDRRHGLVRRADAARHGHAAGIDALYFAGYTPEAGVIVRQARSRGYDLEIGSDALISEYFWRVAGPAAVGVKFVSYADPRTNREAAPVVERFRADGYEPEGLTLYSYAGVEVWAQAVGKAGTLEPTPVAAALHTHEFDTILGRIGFDAKGDVFGYEPFVWYVWREGNYAPVDPAKLTD